MHPNHILGFFRADTGGNLGDADGGRVGGEDTRVFGDFTQVVEEFALKKRKRQWVHGARHSHPQ